ncbi:precorrin-8X methylmutase [Ferrimonas lipolytica]|uniref:Precorrin-8X methylmutase n=1 Tax=Ferrimonas lipolytica TaxID=2724191 RepID=A0A6H1UJN5_9GAMM|nr:precorrin-8X methylmutase [Ferrimonas lipolytica]QIZ78820.1 precorrin-8X methylmutase [Ferrimonas lipolytica]
MKQLTAQGQQIERDSFGQIDLEIERDHGGHNFTHEEWAVVRRVIHSSGDFEFADLFCFSEDAAERGIAAIRNGANIVTDVNMIVTGLSDRRMAQFGNSAHCLISEPQVIEAAVASGKTRAIEAAHQAAKAGLLDGAIIGIGNAPTALFEFIRMAQAGEIKPALIIGLPVGFVRADESKQVLMDSGLEHISCRGRKGGSTLVVAALHALMVEAAK